MERKRETRQHPTLHPTSKLLIEIKCKRVEDLEKTDHVSILIPSVVSHQARNPTKEDSIIHVTQYDLDHMTLNR